MFTGLVECTATVAVITVRKQDTQAARLVLDVKADVNSRLSTPFNDVKLGDSLAVNGCCLTATDVIEARQGDQKDSRDHSGVPHGKALGLTFDLSSETLACTSLGRLVVGDVVNLERALRLGDRLGGHMVSGHIDGLAEVCNIEPRPDGWLLQIFVPPEIGRYVIPKGSICLDGVSLTVNALRDVTPSAASVTMTHRPPAPGTIIDLMLIQTTVSVTNLRFVTRGKVLNVEVDLVGKYLERLALRGADSPHQTGRL